MNIGKMPYCKKCEKDVEPVLKGNRYFCPDCNLFVKATDTEKEESQVSEVPIEPAEIPDSRRKKESTMEQEGTQKLLVSPKTVKYDAADLHMGEILINLGYAKNLNDLTRKNMKLAFSLMNMGAVGQKINAMENVETKQEPDPQMRMKQIQEQKLMDAYIKSMDGGGSADPLTTMLIQKMLDNQSKGKDSGENGWMDKLMQLKMMESMGGGNQNVNASLQTEIADLKHQQSMYQMTMQQQQTQSGQQASNEYMLKMERMRTDHQKQIKEIELMAQKERDERTNMAFNVKLQEIQTNMEKAVEEAKQTGKQADLAGFREQFKTVKEMSALIGDKEKTTAESLGETLGSVAQTLAPAIQTLANSRREQALRNPPQFPPEPMPEQIQPQQAPANPGNPGNTELTKTEQEMSSKMQGMYFSPQDETEEA